MLRDGAGDPRNSNDTLLEQSVQYGTRLLSHHPEHSVVRRAYFSLTHFLDLVGWFVAPGIILSRMRLNHCGLQLTVCGVVV